LKHLAFFLVLALCASAASSTIAQQLKRPGASMPNHAVINGTGIVRTGSGPGTVGGTAKNTRTSINGSAIRPRH
jgi:hypothetical protein